MKFKEIPKIIWETFGRTLLLDTNLSLDLLEAFSPFLNKNTTPNSSKAIQKKFLNKLEASSSTCKQSPNDDSEKRFSHLESMTSQARHAEDNISCDESSEALHAEGKVVERYSTFLDHKISNISSGELDNKRKKEQMEKDLDRQEISKNQSFSTNVILSKNEQHSSPTEVTSTNIFALINIGNSPRASGT